MEEKIAQKRLQANTNYKDVKIRYKRKFSGSKTRLGTHRLNTKHDPQRQKNKKFYFIKIKNFPLGNTWLSIQKTQLQNGAALAMAYPRGIASKVDKAPPKLSSLKNKQPRKEIQFLMYD